MQFPVWRIWGLLPPFSDFNTTGLIGPDTKATLSSPTLKLKVPQVARLQEGVRMGMARCSPYY